DALGFDAATITGRHADQAAATIGATDQRMLELDAVQYESGQGPCLSVLDQPGPILVEDVAAEDERWREFGHAAAHLGVRTTLSVHVPTDSDEMAASLN